MKTLVVVASGASDRPLEELGGRTPLEAAATPVLDRLAREGRLGRISPAPEGQRPEEGAFVLGLFGLDAVSYADVGGVLDAAAFDVPVGSLDQVFRLSLVTADGETLFDPTAGQIGRDEARLLLDALNGALHDDEFVFHAGDGPRNVLVWKGARDVRVRTVPPYEVLGRSLSSAMPRGTGVGRLLATIDRGAEVLAGHEVNELRRELGENPASLAWPWGPGVQVPLPDFEARLGASACAIGVDPSFVGAARLQGIPTPAVEGATGRPDSNLRAKADAALAALETHGLVFLHVGALAAASHVRDFVAKVESLERIDGYVVGAAVRAIEAGLDARLAFIAGPTVSCETGRVLADPVPFAILGSGVRSHRRAGFTEVAARDAGFEVERAHELVDFLLHLPE